MKKVILFFSVILLFSKEIEPNLYYYKAKVVKVYDGDTITVDIDLGFGICKKNEKLRLLRINAPEVKGKERKKGLIARDWLREKILNKKVLIKTIKTKKGKDKKGKYGRYLAEIYLDGKNINDALVKNSFAKYHKY